jgi:hypothetical protein
MSGVAGLRGTGTGASSAPDWGPDERPKNFRENILFFSPNGTSPIFALTSKAGKKTVDDPEFSWWAESQNLNRLQVNGTFAAGDTTIIVDSPDPTANTMWRLYGTATHLKQGDLLLVEKTDQATYDNEIIEVQTVMSDTQFTALRGVAGTTAGTIADDAFLTLIGNSYAEGTGAPKAVSRNPQKFTNYTQIFKDTYELTGTTNETRFRTGNPWSNDKKRKSFDHAKAIEMSILFGKKHETIGDNGKPKRFFGGLREFIPQGTPATGGRTTIFGATPTAATFSDAVAPVFDFDLGGGDTRIAFMGNHARTTIGQVIQATTGVRMELGDVVKMWGINFQELIMPMGRLLMKSHPLLSIHPRYNKSMFVLDFSAVKYVALKNRDTKTHDDVQNKDEDVRRGYIQTECGLMVDGGGLSLAYVGNITTI